MCLSKLKPVSTKKGYGWKVMRIYPESNNVVPLCHDEPVFTFNQWIKDKHEIGFFLYLTKKDAEESFAIWSGDLIIRKTYYRNVIKTGLHGLKDRFIVAREIYIEDKE